MIFNVPALREDVGDPLDIYSVNHDNSPTQPLFRKGRKKIRLVAEGKDCELGLEICELVGGQIMR